MKKLFRKIISHCERRGLPRSEAIAENEVNQAISLNEVDSCNEIATSDIRPPRNDENSRHCEGAKRPKQSQKNEVIYRDCHADKSARNDAVVRNGVCAAFSLIEAMIILLLISIAVMALIPLISKSSTPLGWKVHRDNNAITYMYFGDKSNNRVGIGNVNPYAPAANNPRGKVVTDNAWIGTTRDIFAPNMLGGDVCTVAEKAAINNGIFIRSQNDDSGNFTACTANNIQINNVNGSDLQWIPDAVGNEDSDELIIKSGDKEVISLKTGTNGENEFTITSPDTTEILKYENSAGTYTLTTNANSVNITGGTLYLTNEQKDVNGDALTNDTVYHMTGDPPSCQAVTPSPTTADIVGANGSYYWDDTCSQPITIQDNTFTCQSTNINNFLYTSDTAYPHCGVIVVTDQVNPSHFFYHNSDKRLKNVLSKYTKSIDDVNKIDTYNFTYKNDKKHQLFVGLIAQKIKGIFDEALHTDDKGYLSYEKTPILYAMVNSVKDIFNHQKLIAKKQAKLNKKADKLLKKYGEI